MPLQHEVTTRARRYDAIIPKGLSFSQVQESRVGASPLTLESYRLPHSIRLRHLPHGGQRGNHQCCQNLDKTPAGVYTSVSCLMFTYTGITQHTHVCRVPVISGPRHGVCWRIVIRLINMIIRFSINKIFHGTPVSCWEVLTYSSA